MTTRCIANVTRKNGAVVTYQVKAWWDEDIMKQWIVLHVAGGALGCGQFFAAGKLKSFGIRLLLLFVSLVSDRELFVITLRGWFV